MYSSKNLRLRPFVESDANYINEMRFEFVAQLAAGGSPFPMNLENHKEWISKMYPYGVLTNIHFAVEEIESNDFVGYCSATSINYINRNAHVGFFIHKNARGKKYFKEIQILFYAYLFNEINLKKVYSHALAYNEIAIHTDKKIGFEVDGILKEHIFQSGKYHDALMLSLTKERFFLINPVESIVLMG